MRGAWAWRARMRSMALMCCWRAWARCTASRIKSAMTALLFCPAKVALKASLTSSGTLKLTVDMAAPQVVENFNNIVGGWGGGRQGMGGKLISWQWLRFMGKK